MTRLLRLLTLVAVLLMPFGMTASPAGAHQRANAAAMQHCPEQGSNHGKAGFNECAMACSAALPASEPSSAEVMTAGCSVAVAEVFQQLHGRHAETAVPPPRQA